MTPHAGTSFPGHAHPGPALGCAPCLASIWLVRQQLDQAAGAGTLASWSVPGNKGDVKDNPKPVLVWGLGRKNLNMSPCTDTGVPGVAAYWLREQLDILSLLDAFSSLFCHSLRPADSLVTLELAAGAVVGHGAANTTMASHDGHAKNWRQARAVGT